MKRLEKILVIGTLVLGIGLVSYGLYKEKQLLRGAGLLVSSYPMGMFMRKIMEENDKGYEEKNNISPRQNNSQKGL